MQGWQLGVFRLRFYRRKMSLTEIWTMDLSWITLQVLSFKIGDLQRNQNPEKVKVSQSNVRLLVDRWNHNLGL